MRKIGLVNLLICLIMIIGCAYQEPVIIKEPAAPRVVIKTVPIEMEAVEEEEYFESNYYPDLTKGYIENRAFPYVPEVWLLVGGGRKVPLISSSEAGGPPQIARGAIREVNLPLSEVGNILHIYRWAYLPQYGGWNKLKQVEIVKVPVVRFPRSTAWSAWSRGHYGWAIVIYQTHSAVYSGYVP